MHRLQSLLWALTLFATACDRQQSSAPQTPTTAPSAPAKLILQLNWKPEPEFGGFYTAKQSGAYARHNLDIDIVPGGVGTPTVQMLAAGKVPFGIISADELIIARSNGADVVALFAV